MAHNALLFSRTSLAFGLTFVPAEALDLLSHHDVEPAQALVDACRELEADFAFVHCCEQWSADALELLLNAGVTPFWAVDGPLWPVLQEYGVTQGLRATLTRPDEVAARIDGRIDTIVEQIRHGVGLGARAIVIAEDLAGAQGPLVAPDFAIEVLFPRMQRLVGIASAAGVPCVLHSDGDIRLLLGAILKAGFSGVHAGGGLDFDGFERLFLAARKMGLVVIGGLQTVELGQGFPKATALGSQAGILAALGGLLLADDGGLTEPLQVAMLAAALMAARGA
ncbi:MAG: uroporphyrinogen decarboxylase family protein [Coriobacteriia bacterium]|nr:uroporphyrinogen decarboxylase family protein [Coriobacteriia bacterium]